MFQVRIGRAQSVRVRETRRLQTLWRRGSHVEGNVFVVPLPLFFEAYISVILVFLSNECIIEMVFPYLQECENEMKTQTKTMEDGTVKEYYVPKEQEEDKLFDSGITQGINFAKYDKISVSLTKF